MINQVLIQDSEEQVWMGFELRKTTLIMHSLISTITQYYTMPIVTVSMYTGRTQRDKDKDRLAEAITEDVVNILKVEKKDVKVVFQEIPHGNWYASGVRL
jgi:4-oxalocrotonate tautomerase